MTVFVRKLAVSAAALALVLGASPALAKTHHHVRHVAKSHCVCSRATHHASGNSILRIAQNHLANLGYYHGNIDGIMGPATRAAIKKFQHEHGLKADGVLGSRTNRALARADGSGGHQVLGTHSFETHDVVTPYDANNAVNPDYQASQNGATKPLSSRFGRIDVSENGIGADKRYSVNVNGQPVLTADGQPSIIGVSPTYDLGNEDAVIFTTYTPTDANCMYKNHVLALNATGSQMLDIGNCTRGYQAHVDNGSLYISFPEYDDGRMLGATWRVEGMTLNRL